MKLCGAALLLTIIALSRAHIIHDAGQPGCKTDVELTVKNYRNVWDPTAYWVCQESGKSAAVVRCPDGEAWQDKEKKCVDWSAWEWEEPVEPPSRP